MRYGAEALPYPMPPPPNAPTRPLPGTWGSSKPVGIFHWSTCSLSALTSSMSPGTLGGLEQGEAWGLLLTPKGTRGGGDDPHRGRHGAVPEDALGLVPVERQHLLGEARLHPGQLPVGVALLLHGDDVLQGAPEHGGVEDGVLGVADLLDVRLLQALRETVPPRGPLSLIWEEPVDLEP